MLTIHQNGIRLMAAKFIAEEGALKGLVLSFDEGKEWTIGRDPDVCTHVLEDASVSRKHVMCYKTDEGVSLKNLSDTNPIEVNDEAVADLLELQHGDVVKIGDGIYRFYTETAAHIIDADEKKEDEENSDSPNSDSGSSSQNSDSQVLNGKQPNQESPSNSDNNNDNLALEESDFDSEDSIFEETGPKGERDTLAEISMDLAETGRWLLKVVSGPNNGAEFSMDLGNAYTIGVDAVDCEIVFHDISVSRKHATIHVSEDGTLEIEDLKSRNGVLLDGEKIDQKASVNSQNLLTLGTTSFVLIDREADSDTVVSPPLASLNTIIKNKETINASHAAVQTVPSEEKEKLEGAEANNEKENTALKVEEEARLQEEDRKRASQNFSSLIAMGVLTTILLVFGMTLFTLFDSQEVIEEQLNAEKILTEALTDFPLVKFNYNKNTGKLLLLGHIFSTMDHSQLTYNLQGHKFITDIDDNVVIDELVWQEINLVITKNPNWRSVNVYSPEAGKFVLSGYLESKEQADALADYLSLNFPFPELLEHRLVVEEDILLSVDRSLRSKGLTEILVDLDNGELILTGNTPYTKVDVLLKLIKEFKDLSGITDVKNQTVEVEQDQSMVNLSDKYEVTGFSGSSEMNMSIIIRGKILTIGDNLDGMTITQIRKSAIFLEKDGFKYRIDYKK